MIRPIIQIGDPKLRQVSEEITEFNQLPPLIDDMFETMYHAKGIGLAAVQIGILKRVFVIDIPEETPHPLVMVNPEIVQRSNDQFEFEEGCLSIPGINGLVSRPRSIKVSYQDIKGQKQEILADEILSTCIQHELDHLNGVLFLERIDQKRAKKMKEELERKNLSTIHLAKLDPKESPR